ncbi:MAG: hypothetical protein J6W71_07395 [Methanobrevibacter sp.]|nr:hypothetical protein [Methanobrevibacter sp.]
MDQTVTSIGEIKERVDSNDKDLAEIKESINNLSRDVDYLIEIIEKKE